MKKYIIFITLLVFSVNCLATPLSSEKEFLYAKKIERIVAKNIHNYGGEIVDKIKKIYFLGSEDGNYDELSKKEKVEVAYIILTRNSLEEINKFQKMSKEEYLTYIDRRLNYVEKAIIYDNVKFKNTSPNLQENLEDRRETLVSIFTPSEIYQISRMSYEDFLKLEEEKMETLEKAILTLTGKKLSNMSEVERIKYLDRIVFTYTPDEINMIAGVKETYPKINSLKDSEQIKKEYEFFSSSIAEKEKNSLFSEYNTLKKFKFQSNKNIYSALENNIKFINFLVKKYLERGTLDEYIDYTQDLEEINYDIINLLEKYPEVKEKYHIAEQDWKIYEAAIKETTKEMLSSYEIEVLLSKIALIRYRYLEEFRKIIFNQVDDLAILEEVYRQVITLNNEAYLNKFDKNELKTIKNTMYAKRGYIFTKAKEKRYFESKSWYKGTKESRDILNQDEEWLAYKLQSYIGYE